jgi:NosR/NirI family transcriptional regulator, nitrous oxide reductase regulator
MKKLERIAGVLALVAIAAAWVIGTMGPKTELGPSLRQALPQASEFKPHADGVYAGHSPEIESSPPVGYVAVVQVDGYGGPMRVAVGLDMSGNLTGVSVVDHKETLPFFNRIKIDNYVKSLVGKGCSDSFIPGADMDAVSGATVSLNALATSLRRGTERAAEGLGIEVYRSEIGDIETGFPEIILVLLFAAGFLTYSKPMTANPKARTTMRWVTRLAGLALLGFVLTIPLSIININSLLLGYWFNLRVSIYWYLLIVGVFGPLILTDKNTYCQCICPFGAAQDVLKAASKAKLSLPNRLSSLLRWIQRMLALTAIITALLYRNPARFDYEIFGTFFTLIGTVAQFALLGVVLIAAMFLVRPWCNFLCPIRAVSDYIRMLRLWGKDTFTKRPNTKA